MNPIRLAMLNKRTAYRVEPPGTGSAEWSWEDWALAAGMGGCTEIEETALQVRWCGEGKRSILYAALMIEAVKAEQRHGWSERLSGRRYLEPMVNLALDCEYEPQLDGLKPLLLESENGWKRFPGWWCKRLPWLSEPEWVKLAEPRYDLIRQPLDIWVGEAIRKARPALRDDEDEKGLD